MDDDVKVQLIASAVQAVGVPLLRAGVDNHYRMKQIERQEEMEMKVAERRARGLRAMQGGQRRPRREESVAFENPGDVYDELEGLRTQTDCQFCHGVIDSLMDAPPSEAKDGYEELRSYVREVERMKERDVSQTEAEEIVAELIDRWEVVPRHAAGLA